MSEHRGRRRRVVTFGWLTLALVVGSAAGLLVVLAAGDRVDEKLTSVTAETAHAGQCVDIAEETGGIDITESSCVTPHDAEIVLTTEFGDAYDQGDDVSDAEAVCAGLMAADDVDRLDEHDGELVWGLLIDDPDNVDDFDRIVCYVRDADGPLVAPLLD